MRVHGVFLLGMALGAGALQGQIADLSGTWHLDAQKSHWGKMRRPASVTLQIDHREPVFRYTGVVVYGNDQTRHFTFDGALDGKPYPGQRSWGAGTVSLTRVSPTALTSVFRSEDGKYVETVEISLSRDRKVLTQQMSLTCPEGKRSWTEVYQKR